MNMLGVKRDYRAISFALASAALGVIIMRLVVYFAPLPGETYGQSLCADLLFSLPTQLLFFLVIPFLIYRFYGKRTFKGVCEFSSAGRFEPYFLLAIPLGVCVWLTTLGVSSVWQAILSLTGYNAPTSVTPKPESFVFGFFVVDVLLTAVLPAVCEEFVMRGGVLTTLKKSMGTVGCVVFCAVAFGLFHQNVKQVFYTSLFGALAAFVTLKTKSIYPAMLMHFTNNFCSVFFDYADDYKWAGVGGLFDGIDFLAAHHAWALAIVFICVAGIGVGLVLLIAYMRDKRVTDKKKDVIIDSGFDVTHGRVALTGEFSEERVQELEMEKEVFGADYKAEKYKPTVRELAVIIAAAATTALTTIFTYVWGFFY